MNKNELSGVIGIAVITIFLGISVPVVMASAFALGIILLVITVFLGIGVIVSVVKAIQEHRAKNAPVVDEDEEQEENVQSPS